MNAEEAVNLVVESVRKNPSVPVMKVLSKLRSVLEKRLDREAKWVLICWGLQNSVQRCLTPNLGKNPGNQVGRKLRRDFDILRHIYYMAANGQRKCLNDFTISDFEYFQKERVEELAGCQRRIDAAQFAKDALKRCGAEKVRNLPTAVRKDVRDVWENTMRRRDASRLGKSGECRTDYGREGVLVVGATGVRGGSSP